LRGEYLLIQEYEICHTSYHLTSTLSDEVSVTVEHARRTPYELFETPEPLEQAAGFARWDVACPPDTRTVFEVRERRLISRQEQVRSLTHRRLQEYLRDKYLDAATVGALNEVLGIYQQIEAHRRHLRELKEERERDIYGKQKQIQGNIAPLSHEGDERVLRQRYVAELNRLEDRLAAIEQDEKQTRESIEKLEATARQQLEALSRS
jgi:DNA phosphorothioation-dependent restriction protein DptG